MIESYAIFVGLDNSALALNPYLDGHEFVSIDLPKLETQFPKVFNMPESYDRSEKINSNGGTLSMSFHRALQRDVIGQSAFFTGGLVMLRSLTTFDEEKVPDGQYSFERSSKAVNILTIFSRKIARALRLVFGVGAHVPHVFCIDSETRWIGHSLLGPSPARPFLGSATINAENLPEFVRVITRGFPDTLPKELCLALTTFDALHIIDSSQVQFIMLITCLECIFNAADTQIAHTISRHAALLHSATSEQFQEEYHKMKTLYNKRSKLVHGVSSLVDQDQLQSAFSVVRCALLWWLERPNLSKAQLMSHFNALGFSAPIPQTLRH